MRVLLLGATGFVGRHVAARLLADGFDVVGAVRDVDGLRRRFPGMEAVRVDLNRVASAEAWPPMLEGVGAVVNCAGVLQSGGGQSARAVHALGPISLFEACERAGVARVVQVSAVSADAEAGTEYALTKRMADDDLRGRALSWTVLRPSLVYASGSYGGTSAIRGLAGFPLATPVVGAGDQRFQPIHADDLARTVSLCLTRPELARVTLEPCGPDTLTLRDIVRDTRRWLDLPPAPVLPVPEGLVRLGARVGDLLGTGPIRTTAIDQMRYGNVSDPAAFAAAVDFRPRTMAEAFRTAPSHVQDRWHARLFFLRPALTVALVALWAGSGLAGLLNPPADAAGVVAGLHLPGDLARPLGAVLSLVDLLVAALLAAGRAPRRLALAQLLLVAAYTAGLALAAPAMWADPYGALLKNLPTLLAIAAWAALLDDR